MPEKEKSRLEEFIYSMPVQLLEDNGKLVEFASLIEAEADGIDPFAVIYEILEAWKGAGML